MHIIFLPDLNTLISIDGNGEKKWTQVTEMLTNQRSFLRSKCDASMLIYKIMDAMIDEVTPRQDYNKSWPRSILHDRGGSISDVWLTPAVYPGHTRDTRNSKLR